MHGYIPIWFLWRLSITAPACVQNHAGHHGAAPPWFDPSRCSSNLDHLHARVASCADAEQQPRKLAQRLVVPSGLF